MTKEEFKRYYQKEKVTSSYTTQRMGNKYRRKKREEELKIFLGLLDKKDGEKVLEVGSSNGFLTEHLGKDVTAIDTSKEMLKFTKEKNPEAEVIEADMFKLPFKKKTFDKVVVMRVWNHLNEEDLRLVLRESKRVLKNGGHLIFDMEEKSWLRRFIHFFYKKLFGVTGFNIYQYSIGKMTYILSSENFFLEKHKELNHRIGRQIIWRIRNL